MSTGEHPTHHPALGRCCGHDELEHTARRCYARTPRSDLPGHFQACACTAFLPRRAFDGIPGQPAPTANPGPGGGVRGTGRLW